MTKVKIKPIIVTIKEIHNGSAYQAVFTVFLQKFFLSSDKFAKQLKGSIKKLLRLLSHKLNGQEYR